MYLPVYKRGQSLAGYVAGCSTNRNMVNNISSMEVRRAICQEHAEQMRTAMRQPFTETPRKLGQK